MIGRVCGFPWVAALVLSTACQPPSQAADPGISQADSIVSAWVSAERIPGAVLLVSRDGEVVHHEAYGAAQLFEYGDRQDRSGSGAVRRTRPTAMSRGTVFDVASVTKVMATTMAVMLLVDAGSLRVETPVSSVLPDFVGGGKETITIEHLLTHRSGLEQWVPTYYHATNSAEAYSYIRSLPLRWPVGAERHYSDLGFLLLGLVVERTTGQPLNEVVGTRLYEPLGLLHTGFNRVDGARLPNVEYAATSHGNPFERRMVYDLDFGYRIEGDPEAWGDWRARTLVGEVNDGNAYHTFAGVAGHAGLFSTATDLNHLLGLLLGAGIHRGERYLSTDVVDRFLTTTGDGQALGWQTPNEAPPTSFSHTGFTGTYVYGNRAQNLSIVLLTNRQNLGVDESTEYPDVGPLQLQVMLALTGDR